MWSQGRVGPVLHVVAVQLRPACASPVVVCRTPGGYAPHLLYMHACRHMRVFASTLCPPPCALPLFPMRLLMALLALLLCCAVCALQERVKEAPCPEQVAAALDYLAGLGLTQAADAGKLVGQFPEALGLRVEVMEGNVKVGGVRGGSGLRWAGRRGGAGGRVGPGRLVNVPGACLCSDQRALATTVQGRP